MFKKMQETRPRVAGKVSCRENTERRGRNAATGRAVTSGRNTLTDQHVRGGQRRDEVVARLSDGPVHDERHQHQYVAGDGEHHAHADDQHDDDLLPRLERRQDGRELRGRHRRRPVGRHRRAGRAVVDGDRRTVDDGLFHLRTAVRFDGIGFRTGGARVAYNATTIAGQKLRPDFSRHTTRSDQHMFAYIISLIGA